jgi:ABC-2 type transport system ATP-binding protein
MLRLGTQKAVLRPGSEAKISRKVDDSEIPGADPRRMTTTEVPQEPAAIAVQGLTKRFGAATAVDDLTFTVRPGAITGFLGPNGAGKTTALAAIVGLMRPTRGRVLIDGRPIGALAPDARRLGVCIEPCGAHPGRSARAHLRSLAAIAGLPSRRVGEVLDVVGLKDVAGRRVGKFSLGMRQRLGLGAALLGDPRILVLDEPINGLDPQGIRWLRSLLRERADAGATVLLSSHALAEAAQTVDDVVVIHRGRLVRQGSIADFERLGGAAVSVSTPTPDRLAAVVARAGGRVSVGDGADRLLIEGMRAAEVAELAHGERVVVHEIAPRGASLEDVYLNLTEEDDA